MSTYGETFGQYEALDTSIFNQETTDSDMSENTDNASIEQENVAVFPEPVEPVMTIQPVQETLPPPPKKSVAPLIFGGLLASLFLLG
jgi:hypothetical protein